MINVRVSALGSRVTAGPPDRWTGRLANPVGHVRNPTRETAPLSAMAPARVQHPKLNTSPWSTSFAVKRKPVKNSKSKGVAHG
jgi:hypothetical protein